MKIIGVKPFKEYDLNPNMTDVGRGSERIVIDSLDDVWYTNSHYDTFRKVLGL